MKKILVCLIAIMMVAALALTGCGGSSDEGESTSEPVKTEEKTTTETVAVVKTIDEIDTEDMPDIPLQIESVTLYEDGTVKVVPLDKVKEIAETNDELKDGAVYPFEDIGEVKDIYLVRFGNGGYRTVIALMEDGTLSAFSAKNLTEEHIIVVMPNLTGRDNYVSVEQVQDEEAFGVVGITENDDEIELDYSLDF